MELKFYTKTYSKNTGKLSNEGGLMLSAYTSKSFGMMSHNICIEIGISEEGKESESYIAIELNKNQAAYLANFLNTFVQEKDIDINAED